MSAEPNTGDVCPSCNGDMSWPDGCDECGGSGIANPAVRAQMAADFRAPEAPACTEAAPCFACLRCFVTLTNILATDPNVRAHMTGIETRPAWEPAWKHAAEANGLLPSADAYRVGPLSTERTITLTAAHVATLPTGERVELPAGTVLREGAGAIDHRHLLACARGVVDHDAAQALTGPVAHALLSALRVACGDSIEDVAQRAGLPREMAPSEWPTPRAMAEIACRKRTIGQGFQSGFEEGVIAERARFEAAPLVSLADYAKPRT